MKNNEVRQEFLTEICDFMMDMVDKAETDGENTILMELGMTLKNILDFEEEEDNQ